MGFFRRKRDPLAQRSASLNRRIVELEAEISRLNQKLDPPPSGRSGPATPPPKPPRDVAHASDPVFVSMPPRPVDERGAGLPGREAVQLGLKRPLWSQWWRRLKRHFVDPPPVNEKLVSYLAAGSIQGLRPLRYERRIARNRIIFVCVVLGLLLWGVLVVFWRTQ